MKTKQELVFLTHDHPAIKLSGSWQRKDDCAIPLDRRCTIGVKLNGVSAVYGVFVSHDWSGRIVILDNGKITSCADLYSHFHYKRILTLRTAEDKGNARLEIRIIGQSEHSSSFQAVLCGLLLLRGEYSARDAGELGYARYPGEGQAGGGDFQELQEKMIDDWCRAIRESGRNVEEVVRSRYLAYSKRVRQALLYADKGDRLLDIGAGNISEKILLEDIMPSGIDYRTHDIDRRVVEGTKHIFSSHGLDPGNAVLGENTALPYDDGFFSIVFSSHCIEHSRDLARTFSEIWRVLRPKGYLVYAVPFGWDDTDEHMYALNIEDWIHLTAGFNFDVLSWHVGKEYPESGYDLLVVGQKQ